MEKIYHANTNQKKAGEALLISDRTDFKVRKVIWDKEGHYIMIKGPVLLEDITIINMHAPNKTLTNYTKQKLIELQGETD